jgi:hypothetical protein
MKVEECGFDLITGSAGGFSKKHCTVHGRRYPGTPRGERHTKVLVARSFRCSADPYA